MKAKQLFDLTGRVAIVTGGYTGIGRQMAEGLAEAGANLVICARNLDGCIKGAEEIGKQTGVETLALKCDVASPQDVENMVKDTLNKFDKIDILVNNAGIATGGLPEDIKLEDWENVLRINLTGTFLCSKEVGKVMIKSKKGKIIVLLLKHDSSTEWYRLLHENGAPFVAFIGRLRFSDSSNSPPFPSVLAILSNRASGDHR